MLQLCDGGLRHALKGRGRGILLLKRLQALALAKFMPFYSLLR